MSYNWFKQIIDYYVTQTNDSVCVLESQIDDLKGESNSYLFAEPVHECVLTWDSAENGWEKLITFIDEHIANWIVLHLSYDLKNDLEEQLQSENDEIIGYPKLVAWVPDVIVRYQKENDKTEIVSDRKKSIDKISKGGIREYISGNRAIKKVISYTDKADYIELIQKIKRDIAEGDYYELNLSRLLRFESDIEIDAFALYKKMKLAGPVPMAVFSRWNEITLVSASPERFIRFDGQTIVSEPIKGTRKRNANREEDQKMIHDLLNSEKDKAENLMIVDLIRHDFSRFCESGSVQVPALFQVRSYSTLHQLTSVVEGKPINGMHPVDMITCCFPMGSMTGAPKIRAMKRIDGYENYRRGIYSGSIGYLNPMGEFDLNVVIRTAIIRDKVLFYGVGGAITADSDPEEEWEETQTKSMALMQALEISKS